jgi:RNA polymerase sigma-70 factor (ECF subfamily)
MSKLKKLIIWDRNKEKEFEALVNRFSRFIKVHIQKFNLQKYGLDPDDISQEVKIKIWKVLHDEKEIKNYASYIKKIVNSSVIDHLRKLKREEGIFNHEKQIRISEQQNYYCPDISEDKHMKEVIGKAVDLLLESRRKVVKLFLLNLTIEEISIFLNWTKDKTRNLLYRGLSDLKAILKEKEIDYEHKR